MLFQDEGMAYRITLLSGNSPTGSIQLLLLEIQVSRVRIPRTSRMPS